MWEWVWGRVFAYLCVCVCVRACGLARRWIGCMYYTNTFITAEAPLHIYGFPGRRVTLTCPRSTSTPLRESDWLVWSKCNIYGAGFDNIIKVLQAGSTEPHIERSGYFDVNKGSLDTLTGHLTIHSFAIDDNGIYRCEWLGHKTTDIKLLLYG